MGLLLLLVGLLGILLVGLVSLLGGLGEPLGSGGTRLLGVGGIGLLLGSCFWLASWASFW